MIKSALEPRSWRNLLLALAAVALAAWGQGLLAQDHLFDGLIIYTAAGMIFALTLRFRGSMPAWDGLFVRRVTFAGLKTSWRLRLGLVAIFAAALLAAAALYLFGEQINLPVAWYLLLGSIALFLFAVYLLSFRSAVPSTAPQQDAGYGWNFLPLKPGKLRGMKSDLDSTVQAAKVETSQFSRRAALFTLLLILLLAAFLRFYHLDTLPYGVWYDEADNALQVRRMIQDSNWRPVYVPSTNLPAHFLYLVLFSFKLFGETILALRAVAAALGLLTVAAAYLAGRELFPGDRRLALVLAFFLAVSRWDINWSRIGMHGVSVPLFELLALGLLLRALRTGSLISFAWAGVSLGLGLSFYTPFRLFPLVLALFLIAWFIGKLSTGQIMARLRAIFAPAIIFALAALLTAAPVIQFSLREPDIFWSRARKMSILHDPNATDLPSALAQNAVKHALMFNYRGDPNGRHNLPGEPMLDALVGILFVLGLFVSLARLKKPRYLLLALWLAVMLVGGILSVTFEAPQSLRSIGTLPAAYALAVLSLELLLAEAEALFRRPQARRFILGALVMLLAFVGGANIYTYFYRQARDFSVWNAFATAETHLAHEIQRLRGDYDLYFDPLLSRHLTTRFLLPDFHEYKTYNPAAVLPVPDPSAGKKGTVLFVAPDSDPTRALLSHFYPAVEPEEFAHPYGGPAVLFTYILDWETIAGSHGLDGRYYQAGGTVPHLRRTDLAIDLDWTAGEPPLPTPLRIDWQGSLQVSLSGPYQFAVDSPGIADMWLDQAPLPLDSDGVAPVINLPAGTHALRLICHVENPGIVRLSWQTPQQANLAPVPASAFYHHPFTGHGLPARFYANDAWAGPPVLSRIDQMVAYYFHHIPLPRPYTVEWRGRLEIPEGGHWALGTEAISATWLEFEGQEVLVNTEPNLYSQVELDIAPGWYDIALRFLDNADHSHVYLYWQPPDRERELIPVQYLYSPVEGSWDEP